MNELNHLQFRIIQTSTIGILIKCNQLKVYIQSFAIFSRFFGNYDTYQSYHAKEKTTVWSFIEWTLSCSFLFSFFFIHAFSSIYNHLHYEVMVTFLSCTINIKKSLCLQKIKFVFLNYVCQIAMNRLLMCWNVLGMFILITSW